MSPDLPARLRIEEISPPHDRTCHTIAVHLIWPQPLGTVVWENIDMWSKHRLNQDLYGRRPRI